MCNLLFRWELDGAPRESPEEDVELYDGGYAFSLR